MDILWRHNRQTDLYTLCHIIVAGKEFWDGKSESAMAKTSSSKQLLLFFGGRRYDCNFLYDGKV